jgi:hypothetical protein
MRFAYLLLIRFILITISGADTKTIYRPAAIGRATLSPNGTRPEDTELRCWGLLSSGGFHCQIQIHARPYLDNISVIYRTIPVKLV